MCGFLPDALIQEAAKIAQEDPELLSIAQELGLEDLGAALSKRAETDVDNVADVTYWKNLKREFFTLLCTDDEKYADLRRQIQELEGPTKVVIIPAIAAAIGAILGIAAGILTPFVALLFLGAAKLGAQAWCETAKDSPLLLDQSGQPLLLPDLSQIAGDESEAD